MRTGVWVAACLCLVLVGSAAVGAQSGQWRKVDEALEKGLPATAIEVLRPIIDDAIGRKAYGEAARAICRKIVLEGTIQGNKPEEKIIRLEAELAKAPAELVPVLDTVLACWYWHYFQNNRWRFMQRTATAQAPGGDFKTWDLTRLFAEIDRKYRSALSAAEMLKRIPVESYGELLEKGTMPDSYRPTLYDFVAHQALAFYTCGEQAGARQEDAFEISAEDPIFDSAAKFMAWNPATDDADSPALKAVRLYQELLRFHEADKDQSAFRDADLGRLVYGRNVAYGEGRNDRLKRVLSVLTGQWSQHELSAMAWYELARVWHDEGQLVQARSAAVSGRTAFPDSPGGRLCRNLSMEIEQKSLAVSTERVWNGCGVTLDVRYRNVTKVYFRAVAWDWEYFLDGRRARPEYPDDRTRKALLAKGPVLEWSANLPPALDFKERLERVPAPQGLKPGFYFIIASHEEGFKERDNEVTFTDVWVSDLALVIRSRAGSVEGFVANARSGEPLEGAVVEAFCPDNSGNWSRKPVPNTDGDGCFSFTPKQQSGWLVKVSHGGQQLASGREYSSWHGRPQAPHRKTIFFTDRAIYRPGQAIHYKGICVAINTQSDEYSLITGDNVEVEFRDANGKEIARQTHRCNDYGSFAGSFTAPRDRLMGAMQLVAHGPLGSTRVQVEEYKRPKFEVTLDVPAAAARLNDKVSLKGKAMAYSGAAIDGAAVKYRVVREVRYPCWFDWCWRGRTRSVPDQEIAHGTARTAVDGTFAVEFRAKPDLSVAEKDEPAFVFSVHADVTDSAGETRSAQQSVSVGYTALQAALSAGEWLTEAAPVAVVIKTSTLDGAGQQAEGVVRIHRLKEPAEVVRGRLNDRHGYYGNVEEDADPSDPNGWELGEVAVEKKFSTGANGEGSLDFALNRGLYRAVLSTEDRFGKRVTALLPLTVLRPDERRLSLKLANLVAAPAWTVEPGKEFKALWGTGYESGRALVEIEHRNRIVKRYWTQPGESQSVIRWPVDESLRGGFSLHVVQVRENRAYLTTRRVDVPWSNRVLDVKWEHFVSKLQPGRQETWTAVVTGPAAQRSVAELVATLYDKSLDAFMMHQWPRRFSFFRQDQSTAVAEFCNAMKSFNGLAGSWTVKTLSVDVRYRAFPADLTQNFYGYGFAGGGGRGRRSMAAKAVGDGDAVMLAEAMPAAAPAVAGVALRKADEDRDGEKSLDQAGGVGGPEESAAKVDLGKVAARKNLCETAFFFPSLMSDSNGVVRMTFTMPEALTQWKLLGFAHDLGMRSGYIEAEAVTSKDLMIQPNAPRFVREGDELEFTVKVSNQTESRQKGQVRLVFFDARTESSVDRELGNVAPDIGFDVPARESRSCVWKIKVPDGLGFLTYKAVGSTGNVSDGEEGYLPVLCRRIAVTESLPLPIRGPAEKKFEFEKLVKSGRSDTLRHRNLVLQMVSNPSWYAVMALPYLMEFPHECSEQTFNRLYANLLGRFIADSDPKVRRVFDLWKGTVALDSPLEKNQELKSVMLEETPWYRQAQSESQARRNVGLLFDGNHMDEEVGRCFRKLAEMQLGDGLWPWFPGGRGNEYITLYIVTGFGRLRHLGVALDQAPALRSLAALDRWLDGMYRAVLRQGGREENHLSSIVALYLYGRSFYLKEAPIPDEVRVAFDYYVGQAKKYWLQLESRQSQGHLALALKRLGEEAAAADIMKSIKERSVTDGELGMFWRETELSWWWYRAPIETQALMIEAFAEVMNDERAVEECKVWLLKQKQTQDWKTTKATADAVYGLLLRGVNSLASDALVEVSMGGVAIKPEKVEAGTGYFEKRFDAAEIRPALGEITVRKVDQGVAWGSVHWQYLEDMTRVTPYEGTPLKLNKALYVKRTTKKGPRLEPVQGAVSVGDELVVRIELRTDRDMEYVHMKDQRGSGLEPVDVISRYRYQDGLAYYESTRDTASHFFIDYLPKGVYVFEYSTRVVHRGRYQSGIAEIQCMYAPEFGSHSGSVQIEVR